MKRIIALTAVCAAFVALAGGITTNLVVYTDIRKPSGTYNLHGTRLDLTIRDGLIVGCRDCGRVDLTDGLAERDALARAAARRAAADAARTNGLQRLQRPQRPSPVSK